MSAPATSILFAVTNQADWVQPIQLKDGETGELIDLTGAAINVRMVDERGNQKFSLTVGDGVEITDTGIFEFTVPASTMTNLCPGSYPIGSIYSLNGEVNDVFVGTVSVVENPGRL